MVAGSPRLGPSAVGGAAGTRPGHARTTRSGWSTADGMPQRGDGRTLAEQVRALERVSPAPRPRRGDHHRRGGARAGARPGEIVLLSGPAGQRGVAGGRRGRRSWWTARTTRRRRTRHRAAEPPAPSPGRATVGGSSVALAGDSGARGAGDGPARTGDPPVQALAHVGGAATLALPGVASGWWTVRRSWTRTSSRRRPAAGVRCGSHRWRAWPVGHRPYVAAACAVLERNRRVTGEVTRSRSAGWVGRAPS